MTDGVYPTVFQGSVAYGIIFEGKQLDMVFGSKLEATEILIGLRRGKGRRGALSKLEQKQLLEQWPLRKLEAAE